MKKIVLIILFPFVVFAQQDVVDFQTISAKIAINPFSKTVNGTVAYTFLMNEKSDSIWIDGFDMKIATIRINNKYSSFSNNGKIITIYKKFKKNHSYTMILSYEVSPKKSLYFVGWNSNGRKQVWSQGQGKDNSHWLPMYDNQTDKVLFDMYITFDENYTVISNGLLQESKLMPEHKKQWHYKMNKPMSSYLLMLAIGKYDKIVSRSTSGVRLENYYYPEEKQYVAATYKYSTQVFNFLEKEIGISFPWEVYRNIPVQDFLYGGMENTTATIYNESYMVDNVGFIDRNYVNVDAHELAHQWFGDYITGFDSKQHWLHEGFATYYALLAEKELFGNDYFEAKIYKNAKQIIAASEHDKNAILSGKASSLSFYQKGAWVLYNLNRKIGKKNFDKAVQNYLQKYAYTVVSTADFITEVNAVTNTDNQLFFDKWLKETIIPYDNLAKSQYNKKRIYVDKIQSNYTGTKSLLLKYLYDNAIHYSIKTTLLANLFQLKPTLDKDIITAVLKAKDVYLYKTLLDNLQQIPQNKITQFESLLVAKSYHLQEQALNLLWIANPKKNNQYLDKMQHVQGFNNYNIHTLWLFLAIIDDDYKKADKKTLFDELIQLTSNSYRFSIRQNAMLYVKNLGYYPPQFYKNLIDASQHFNWRVASPSRKILQEILENPKSREELKAMLSIFTLKEQNFLKNYLK